MTDGNTYAINKHLDDALQEVTAELEQAEVRIEELEAKLAKVTAERDEELSDPHPAFVEACLHWRGHILRGKYAHWCMDWDDLPVDETCSEWPCGCGFQEWKDKEGQDDE